MCFKDLIIKNSYDSAEDDIVEDFYVPVLKESIKYDRIAGFFTSSSLAVSASGILGIVENGGKIRLLVSPRLSSEDVEIMNDAISNPDKYIGNVMLRELSDVNNEVIEECRNFLAHLIASNLLSIRVVLVKSGNKLMSAEQVDKSAIFHQKVGILTDCNGNSLSFSGSINETFSAWSSNVEEFKTFKSWDLGQVEYCNSDKQKFEEYWSGTKERTITIELPNAIKEKFIEISLNTDYNDLKKKINKRREQYYKDIYETLFWYQKQAVKDFESNGYSLLFNMATGERVIIVTGCINVLVSRVSGTLTKYNSCIA